MTTRHKFAVLAVLILVFMAGAFTALALPEAVTSTVGISVQIGPTPSEETVSPSPSSGPGSGDEIIIPLRGEATIVMEGFTSPNALLTFLRNGSVVATNLADKDGKFKGAIKTESGNATFGIWARDSLLLTTQTSNFSLTLPDRTTTTVKDIFLSPTIKILNSASYQGVPQRFSGSSFPDADIYIVVNNEQKELIKTDQDGNWNYSFITRSLNEGPYNVKVRGRIPNLGFISPFSEEISMELKKMPKKSDCNADGEVNIADLSIILYYWHKINPSNSCSDLNSDGVVDIADISVLMYLWTG